MAKKHKQKIIFENEKRQKKANRIYVYKKRRKEKRRRLWRWIGEIRERGRETRERWFEVEHSVREKQWRGREKSYWKRGMGMATKRRRNQEKKINEKEN